MKRLAQRWYPESILIAAVAVLFYKLLLGEVIFWGTPILQFYPWQNAAFDTIRHGQLPLWNPLVGNGAPLLANYQTAVFYPPNWLHLIVPSEYAMGLIGIVHILWAGLGMMAYLRRIGLNRFSQGVGGISYALSGYLIARFGFLSITNTVPWMPWIFWALEAIVREGPSVRPVLWLSFTVGMLLLAGHAQSSAYVLLASGSYFVFRILQHSIGNDRGSLLPLAIRGVTGVLGGIGLAAVQLLPTLELLQTSQRVSGVASERLFAYSFWPWRFITLFSPNFFGSPATGTYSGYGNYWEDATYVGLLTVVLALGALRSWASHKGVSPKDIPITLVPFYAGAVTVAGFLALGKHLAPSQWLYEHVPGLAMFQAPTRWMLVAVFGIVVMGSVGADHWRTDAAGQRWSRRILAAGAAIVIGSVLADRVTDSVIPGNYVLGMARLGLASVVVAALSLTLRRVEWSVRWRPVWEVVALTLLAADLVAAHWGLNPTTLAGLYRQRSSLAELLRPYTEGARYMYTPQDEYEAKFSYFFNVRDFQGRDRDHWVDLRNSLLPNLGMIDGIPSASNDDPLLVGNYDAMLQSLDDFPLPDQIEALQRMNVAVLLSSEQRPDLELLSVEGEILAYQVPDPWPRVVTAGCLDSSYGLQCDRIESGSAAISFETSSQVSIEVTAEENLDVLLLDTYYPGWTATLDGDPVQITLANRMFRAVPVPRGNHQIVMTYRPLSLILGAITTGIALAMWGGAWIYSRANRLSKSHSQEGQM